MSANKYIVGVVYLVARAAAEGRTGAHRSVTSNG